MRTVALVVMVGGSASAELADAVRTAASKVEGHPRLFMTARQAAALPGRVKADATAEAIARELLARAGEMIDLPVSVREQRGRRMLHVSRQALDRICTLSMAWHLTGERRFVERAADELRAVAAFSDWNPSHFLDTAEMTLAVAIGYDWLHAELDEATRATARRAIFEKGLTPALAEGGHWWMRTTNNWNQVCHGGLVAGALVLLEHQPDAALQMIEGAVRDVPNAMASYAPLGAYPEGPGYWAYGTSYNVILLALLESAFGTTFGLDEIEGFDRTAEFPILMTGPSGRMFNFSDGRPTRSAQPAVYWLARQYGRPALAAHEDQLMNQGGRGSWLAGLSLLWRAPADGGGAGASDLPLHWTSRNEVPVSVHRESWEQKDALFAGIKAGPPSASHGQMDAGSFVFDAQGVRWAHDLGMENYHHAESQGLRLWSKHQQADRWTVFRNNNLSHNTLVIDGQLQRASGDSTIARFSDDPAFPHSVVDMSRAYGEQAKQAHRGVALMPGGSLVVRDHLAGLRPGAEVRWGMVTSAKVGETGLPTLALRENGETLTLTVRGADNAAWQATDLAAPEHPWDSPNEGFTMVTFTVVAPDSGTLDLTVVLHPAGRGETGIGEQPLARPMDWSPPMP